MVWPPGIWPRRVRLCSTVNSGGCLTVACLMPSASSAATSSSHGHARIIVQGFGVSLVEHFQAKRNQVRRRTLYDQIRSRARFRFNRNGTRSRMARLGASMRRYWRSLWRWGCCSICRPARPISATAPGVPSSISKRHHSRRLPIPFGRGVRTACAGRQPRHLQPEPALGGRVPARGTPAPRQAARPAALTGLAGHGCKGRPYGYTNGLAAD